MNDNHDKAKEPLRILDQELYQLGFISDPALQKVHRRQIAMQLNTIATLAGLKPVVLGGIPLDDDTDEFTIGEIPT